MHYAVGDIHGCLEAFIRLLQQAGLVDEALRWIGGEAQLWCLGDYTDRGPDGVGVIDLLMRLETEAKAAGGAVNALLGNHDFMFLAAKRYSSIEVPSFRNQGHRITFQQIWHRVGGKAQDFERITEAQLEWLGNRPALALVEGNLLMHADSLFYLECGDTLEEINNTFWALLHSQQYPAWDVLMDAFATRFAFLNGGEDTAREMLNQFGGQRIVHGHTPIYGLLGATPEAIEAPLLYNKGLCLNIDHCLWNGGPGFIVPLDGPISYIEGVTEDEVRQ